MHSWTLLAANTILLGCVTSLAYAVWFFNRQVAGLPAWVASFACGFLASLNYLIRPDLPSIWAYVSITVLTVGTAYFNLRATRQHLGLTTGPLHRGLVLLAALGGLVWGWDILHAHGPLRFALFSLISGGIFLYCGWLLTRSDRKTYPNRYLYGWVCILHGLFLALRPLVMLRPSGPPIDFAEMLLRALPLVIESMIALQIMSFGVLMLVNEHLNAELRRLAQLDPLTDVFNRRAFLNLLDKAVSLAQRRQTVVPLLLIDLDHFKAINDTHGHAQGDLALRHFVGIAQSVIRREDVLGRLGGEEFAIFLPETDLAEAREVAERLRTAVAQSTVTLNGGSLSFTVSIGVATCQHRDALEAAIQQADEAMYQAKAQGRNRVVQAASAG